MSSESGSYQEQLARAIQEKNDSLSEEIIQAFRVVPRHLFVDHYYLHEHGGSRVWTKHEQNDPVAWYEHIYSDCALVTRVDEYGRTLSSSSQPGVMASMLQALDVQPGMHILEVGTGSGYNAALLAHLVGDPHLITTIDIDADAIAKAKYIIPQVVGKGMTIAKADGSNGYDANAPYDRIIVTASTPTIPSAWREQLIPEGILVGILQPKFAMLGGLLKARKSGEALKGYILQTASFMELRPVVYDKRKIQIDFRASLFASFPFEALLFQPQSIYDDHAFTFFLYYDFPGLYVFQKEDALFYYQEASPQGYVIFRQKPTLQVELRGDAAVACSLWNRLIRAYSFWERVGQPAITQYLLEMDSKCQTLSLHTPLGIVWPFGAWSTATEKTVSIL